MYMSLLTLFIGLPRAEGLLQEQVSQGAERGGLECEGVELGGGKVQGVAAGILRRQQAGF